MARVLIIDDDVELLEMMRLALERRLSVQTQVSADGEEGLAMALADPPDLVIVDVMMPSVDGYEICRRLRAESPTTSVPILIHTGRVQPVDRRTAMEAGADEYLAKPATVTQLLDRITVMLSRTPAGIPSLLLGNIVLLSLRGGVGVTTLAVNFAAALAEMTEGETCILDLCPSSGHVALQLGLRPEPNWGGLIGSEQLDAGAVGACLLEHESGLRVLASPAIPTIGPSVSRVTIQTVIGILQRQFALLVVDTPSVLNLATMTALDAATAVGLVVSAEHQSIQTTLGTLKALKPWADKTHVILNQITPSVHWPTGAVQRVLGRAPVGVIPFDPNQAEALREGKPLALHNHRAALAVAVRDVAVDLVRATGGAAA
jgi:CheY-like chemotaxis protein